MEQLLKSIQKLAQKHGYIVFFVKTPHTGNASRDRSVIKVQLEKHLDELEVKNPGR